MRLACLSRCVIGLCLNSPTGAGTIIAIDTSGNSIKWTVSIPGGTPRLFAVPAVGGVIFEDGSGRVYATDSNGVISPLFHDNTGADAGPTNVADLNYWTLGTWAASLNDGGMGTIKGNNTFQLPSAR